MRFVTYFNSSGNVRLLLKNGALINKARIQLPNDIDVDDSLKLIYMSDGSTRYPNTQILRGTLLHDNSGRYTLVHPPSTLNLS